MVDHLIFPVDWPSCHPLDRHRLRGIVGHLNDGFHRTFGIRSDFVFVIDKMNAVFVEIAIVDDLRLAQQILPAAKLLGDAIN